MIQFVRGILDTVSENQIVVENQGIGFGILVPLSVVSALPQTGNEVKIYTYMHVREDAMQLFGFLTKDELAMFQLLITVSGIGPTASADRNADFLANLKIVNIQVSIGIHDFSNRNIIISAEQIKGVSLFYSVYNSITFSAITDISEIIVIHYIASDKLNYAANMSCSR